jgi:hypothetical protein
MSVALLLKTSVQVKPIKQYLRGPAAKKIPTRKPTPFLKYFHFTLPFKYPKVAL